MKIYFNWKHIPFPLVCGGLRLLFLWFVGKLGDLETGFREKLSNSVEKLEGTPHNIFIHTAEN